MLNDSKIQKSESVYFFTNPQRSSQKTILSSCQRGFKSGVNQSEDNAIVLLEKRKHTLCTLMEGNMFWNMVAMSLTCMPSDPKLLRTSSGWWVNCCSCILCFFRDETTSLIREYWKKVKVLIKTGGKNMEKLSKFLAVWAPHCIYFENITNCEILNYHHLS